MPNLATLLTPSFAIAFTKTSLALGKLIIVPSLNLIQNVSPLALSGDTFVAEAVFEEF